jgi:hypothetical protein
LRGGGGRALLHVIDPSMRTTSEATVRQSAERTIRETLGGRVVSGPQAWGPRREAILRVLAPRHEGGQVPLAISPTRHTLILRQSFEGRAYYPRLPNGQVDRSRQKKPNSPHADMLDAGAYVFGWLRPGTQERGPRAPFPARMAFNVMTHGRPRIVSVGRPVVF